MLKLGIFNGAFGNGTYGGNQNNYNQKYKVNTGCAAVAATNTACYLASKGGKYKNLFNCTINNKNYLKLMDLMYDKYIKPNKLFGFWYARDFAKRFVKFAKSKNVNLKSNYILNYFYSTNVAAKFISSALNHDLPVVMINHFTSVKYFSRHWITITAIKHDIKNDDYILKVSSCGKKYNLSLKKLWSENTYSGLIFFR